MGGKCWKDRVLVVERAAGNEGMGERELWKIVMVMGVVSFDIVAF